MPALVAGIHVLATSHHEDVDGRDIGERSDALLRAVKPGHDAVLQEKSSPSP
jgi:hypothetical protein